MSGGKQRAPRPRPPPAPPRPPVSPPPQPRPDRRLRGPRRAGRAGRDRRDARPSRLVPRRIAARAAGRRRALPRWAPALRHPARSPGTRCGMADFDRRSVGRTPGRRLCLRRRTRPHSLHAGRDGRRCDLCHHVAVAPTGCRQRPTWQVMGHVRSRDASGPSGVRAAVSPGRGVSVGGGQYGGSRAWKGAEDLDRACGAWHAHLWRYRNAPIAPLRGRSGALQLHAPGATPRSGQDFQHLLAVPRPAHGGSTGGGANRENLL